MKKIIAFIALTLLITFVQGKFSTVQAASTCGWPMTSGSYTAAADCTLDADSSDYYDYSSGTDDASNGFILNISTHTITINSGSAGTTTLGLGQILASSTGHIALGSSKVLIDLGSKCYVSDCDSDLYSSQPTTCSKTTATCANSTAYIRKNKLTSASKIDCYDLNANAKPGQTTYYTTTRGTAGQGSDLAGHSYNSYIYDCNNETYNGGGGNPVKQYGESYTCPCTCNNGTYTSCQNLTSGFATTVACGASNTYYTVTSTACLAGSGNSSCPNGNDNTQASATQACR